MPTSRKYRNVVRAVFATPWAILPEKMNAITELLELRASGRRLTKSEVAARIGDGRRVVEQQQEGSAVAVIAVYGVLSQRLNVMEEISGGVSTEQLSNAIRAAANDPQIGRIVLDIDSPGGSVLGIQEAAAVIRDANEKKPVIAVVNSMAASGAYWLASQAGEIVIAPGGQVGSIGVLYPIVDSSEAHKKAGLKVIVSRRPEGKAEGVDGEPLSEAAIAARQKMVDDYYDQFVAAVAAGRRVPEAAVRSGFGRGRMVLAEAAVAEGMAERVATLTEVLSGFGVGKAASQVSAKHTPALSTLEGMQMNPKLFGALVRLGMCPIEASESQAENALQRFFAATGAAMPETVEKQVEALEAHIAKSKAPPAATIPAIAPGVTLPATSATADADRMEGIMAAVKLSGVADAFNVAQTLIADKTLTVQGAVDKLNQMKVVQNPPAGPSLPNVVGTGRDALIADARDAILIRTWGGGNSPARVFSRQHNDYLDWKPSADARGNYGLSRLPKLAEMCLRAEGYSEAALSRLTNWQIAQVAMGVSRPETFGLQASSGPHYNVSGMFANILLDAANVTMRRSYDDARTTFQVWMKQGEDLRDFKLTHKVISGELSDPKAIPEDGEFEEATHSDAKESYALTVWGEVFSISWHAIVNDQLSAFTEIPMKQGNSMRRKQNRLAYGVLKDNAAMADGGALFNATARTSAGGHANLTTGADTPKVSTLNTMTSKMMVQQGLNVSEGGTLNIMPRFIPHPPALRGTILELLGSTANPASGGNSGVKNIWENGLVPVTESELSLAAGGSDTAWYLAADHNEIDTIEYAFLEGLSTPVIEQQVSFERLGLRSRIYQAFAVKALDFRGLQKHAGA